MSRLSHALQTARWRVRQKYLHNFIFVHVPKTAGTSIVHTLGIPRIHQTAYDIRGRIGARRWEQKFKFAFVRNPWDRTVSLFHFASARARGLSNSRYIALTFTDWLQLAFVERHALYFDFPHSFSPQFDWISDFEDRIIVDFVGRFENIQQDFATICERMRRPIMVLPHDNQTNRKDYRYYYKDSDVEIIAKWYEKDINYFGYTFEPHALPRHAAMRSVDSSNFGLKHIAVQG